MKRTFIILMFCFIVNSINAQTNLIDSVQHQGFWRTYKIHVPQSYNPSAAHPLVIVLHGGGHNADTIEYMTNFNEKADSANFIVVYPNGKKFFIQTWNAGTCCGGAVTNNIDDVGFIVKMINDIRNNYNIDSTRIYATGASNGGMLAYRLACERPDLFAAIAPVATTMVTNSACSPSSVVSVLHIHSLIDTHVPYYGGYGSGYANVYMPPVDSITNVWAMNDSCTGSLDTVYNSNGAIGKKWFNCSSCSEVLIYTTTDGGHSWPGGNQTTNGDPPSNQLNATDLIWDFFSQHYLNCSETSVFNNKNTGNNIKVFPNPTNSMINIQFSNQPIHYSATIYNMLGKKITYFENTNQININKLNNGVYLLEIKTDEERKMIKIIKN